MVQTHSQTDPSTSDRDRTHVELRPDYSRRHALKTIGTGLALLAGGIGSTTPVSASSTVTENLRDAVSTIEVTFEGTALTRYEGKGQNDILEQRQIEHLALVTISGPLTVGGVTESNPFGLNISAGQNGGLVSPTGVEGEVALISAYGTYTPETYRPTLLQYWEYDYNEQSGRISGAFTQDNEELGGLFNFITVESSIRGYDYPSAAFVREGATIEGTITSDSIQLFVQGNASDYVQYVPFTVELQGKRTQ